MSVMQMLKYDASEEEFPAGMAGWLRDVLQRSSKLLYGYGVKSRVRLVVAAPPLRRPGRSIMFHVFSSHRTAFGAIKDVEHQFAEWFLETRILPIINPIPLRYYEAPQMLPKDWYTYIEVRGVRIYRSAVAE